MKWIATPLTSLGFAMTYVPRISIVKIVQSKNISGTVSSVSNCGA